MMLENEQQLANTRHKLTLLEDQIAKAKARPDAGTNRESLRSLVTMANQLREEIIRYEAAHAANAAHPARRAG